jgi:uncharacterized protein YicC (UPF0701 family)
MARVRDELLRELQERLTRVSTWLAARRRTGEQVSERFQTRIESVLREIAGVRHAEAHGVHHVVGRARATLEDMDRDYEAPHTRVALRREELQALRRHLRLTANLLPHVSNLDDPGWPIAHEEYERSWDEVRRAFESDGAATAP